jgi:hypothetical protein
MNLIAQRITLTRRPVLRFIHGFANRLTKPRFFNSLGIELRWQSRWICLCSHLPGPSSNQQQLEPTNDGLSPEVPDSAKAEPSTPSVPERVPKFVDWTEEWTKAELQLKELAIQENKWFVLAFYHLNEAHCFRQDPGLSLQKPGDLLDRATVHTFLRLLLNFLPGRGHLPAAEGEGHRGLARLLASTVVSRLRHFDQLFGEEV